MGRDMGIEGDRNALHGTAQLRIDAADQVLDGAAEPAPATGGSGLVVTAGLSPLPVLLTIEELAPRAVLLVRSTDSPLEPADIRGCRVLDCVVPADEPKVIFERVAAALRTATDDGLSWDIGFTGGTKAMSVHAHRAWETLDSARHGRAWYLSDEGMRLRSDHGEQRPLRIADGTPWRIEKLAKIHDAASLPNCDLRTRAPLKRTVAQMFTDGAVGPEDLVAAKLLLDDLKQNPGARRSLQDRLKCHCNTLKLGDPADRGGRYADELKGVANRDRSGKGSSIWFERLVALTVHLTGRLAHQRPSQTYWSVAARLRDPHNRTAKGALCEVDVCHIVGARLWVIEVKFKSEAGATNAGQEDLLAVAQLEYRAEQLGGTLARPGFVTLRPANMVATTRQQSQSIDLAPHTQLFGLDDLGAVLDALLHTPFDPEALRRTTLARWLAP